MARLFNSITEPQLITLLQAGSVGVLATDTLYGLVCRSEDEAAAKRLYALKSRENKPGTIIAAHIEQLVALGMKARYLKAVERFWPGAVSIVVPFSDPAKAYLRQGRYDVAVRITADKKLNKLLKQTGPLLTSSANLPNQRPASTIAEAQSVFGNKVDFYVDGGNLADRKPSSVIRIIDDAVEVLREGAVKIDETGRITPGN